MGPVAGDAVNPSMGAWPRHPCRGHPRNRPHPAFDRFLPLLVGADLSRHGVGSRCHATGSDPDLRSMRSEPLSVGKRIRPRASQAPVATGRLLSLTHPLHELVGADRWSARSRSHGDATDSGPDLRSMGSEPFSVGKRIRPRASQAPVATGRLLSLTQRSTNWWVPTLVGTGSDPVATQRALTPDLRSMRSEPLSVGKRIRPRASQVPVATGRLLSLTQPLHELVGVDLGRHGVGSRGHATGSDPDLRSIGSEPFSVGKRIRPGASQVPVATGRLLSLTQPLQESA